MKCVCSIIAPHMLKSIATSGAPAEKEWAMNSLIHTAQLLGRRNAIGPLMMQMQSQSGTGQLRRTIYDAQGEQSLPGRLVRGENDKPVTDISANEAYDGAGATYNMLLKHFGRNSLDDHGGRLDSTVHYGVRYQNAFFDGQQMIYGDGDGRIFQRFTKAIDVIGHEFCHGVTQATCNLQYYDQSGALNEHFSDVMGSLVKQQVLGQDAATADWLIGSGLLGPTIHGVALRSMKAPGTAYDDPTLGKDPQPDHMSKYQSMDDDDGGVHINSGIPNRAFFLAATGMNDSFKAGLIWYKAWTTLMKSRSQFQDCANFTVTIAKQMFGNNTEANAVIAGWKAVGINPQA